MPKTKKINVMRQKMTVDIPYDPHNTESVLNAAAKVTSIHAHITEQLHLTVDMNEPLYTRTPAPDPAPVAEPVEGDLDPPESPSPSLPPMAWTSRTS